MCESAEGSYAVKRTRQPLVGIVTPVHNGERYLAECIESILAQTYTNWRYSIVDNCSTDKTASIAQQYAARDKRIKCSKNPSFLSIIPNWNYAVNHLPPEAAYCKVVHADDWLFPECLERMVEAAEEHPDAGFIGSYRLDGRRVASDGIACLPPVKGNAPVTAMNGKALCRRTFTRELAVFGTPSSILMRAELVRRHAPLYDEAFVHADTELLYRHLKHCDFAHVHQVLTATRVHEESQSATYTQKLATSILEFYGMLKKHGPDYFSSDEFRVLRRSRRWEHYRFIARKVLRGGSGKLVAYHRAALKRMGEPLSIPRLLSAVVIECGFALIHPHETARRLAKPGV
ncbi:MAG: glycosyltransferase [Chitinivibrionales bacterium]|nr:glycosyltransferase [Chitinivibrionales bacterium]